MHPKLDHCVIHVSDWGRSNLFYCDVVGAELVDRGSGTWAYRFGNEQLNVHGPGVEPDPVARIPVVPGNSDLCFEWADSIEEAVAHLNEHGVQVEDGPVIRNGAKGQGTSVYFRDPDGSLLEFISYVS
jgi:catechol 2,3-dioxygenase-like lactoylglutathione lyase family enzyme